MYLVGILLVLLGALLVKKITGQKYRRSSFIIELPEYKVPNLKRACGSMLERRKAYIVKENVVGTLAVVYGVTNLIDTDELALVGSGSEVATIMGLTKAAALAYLMFNLYTPPCFAALGAMNLEMKSVKWLFGGICLQLATGYTAAFAVYRIGTLITTESLGTTFVPGLIAVIVFALIILWRIRKSDKEFASEYSWHSVRS